MSLLGALIILLPFYHLPHPTPSNWNGLYLPLHHMFHGIEVQTVISLRSQINLGFSQSSLWCQSYALSIITTGVDPIGNGEPLKGLKCIQICPQTENSVSTENRFIRRPESGISCVRACKIQFRNDKCLLVVKRRKRQEIFTRWFGN